MLRFLFLLIALAIAMCALAFAFKNDAPATIDLFFLQLDNLSVGTIALASFAVGGVFGLFAATGMWLRTKRSELSTKRKLAKSEKELETLRAES